MVGQTASVSFFEPPPRPPRPQEPEPPPSPQWWASPRNELGAPVPLRLVLARTDHVAVALAGATAYSTGVTLTVAVRSRRSGTIEDVDDLFGDPYGMPFAHLLRHRLQGGELPPELLRFGVQFSDGRKATSLGGALPGVDEEALSGAVLTQGGGGGGGGDWESDFWLWPVPPPGPVTFAVEWPAREIKLSKQQVDASVFIDASEQSEALWPAEDAWDDATQSSTIRLIGGQEAPEDQG